jgi:hypothetical protein
MLMLRGDCAGDCAVQSSCKEGAEEQRLFRQSAKVQVQVQVQRVRVAEQVQK